MAVITVETATCRWAMVASFSWSHTPGCSICIFSRSISVGLISISCFMMLSAALPYKLLSRYFSTSLRKVVVALALLVYMISAYSLKSMKGSKL